MASGRRARRRLQAAAVAALLGAVCSCSHPPFRPLDVGLEKFDPANIGRPFILSGLAQRFPGS